jgi:hypothetical protein
MTFNISFFVSFRPCKIDCWFPLKAVVDFFYNGIITVDSDSAEQIFTLANTLQVKEVEKLCLTFLNAQQSFASEVRICF